MQAQTKTPSPVGEYYLQGVMETASGFLISEDSSFQFFFSYGAMDREGKGTWRLEGNKLVLNSVRATKQDYSIIKSEEKAGSGFQVKISGAPSHIIQYVRAITKSGEKIEEASANKDGFITFKAAKPETIELHFELCPDKISVFPLEKNNKNYYEFKLEHTITDVAFDNFTLQLHPQELKGPHPLMPAKSFVYKKVDR